MAARQRRKSGDDVLNTSAKEKEKKKETSAGFFDYITRPRSKSDASSRLAKKPNLMTTMKNAVQVRIVWGDISGLEFDFFVLFLQDLEFAVNDLYVYLFSYLFIY